MISVPGKVTKTHIQHALKKVFPGVPFRFSSAFDSVCVKWEDGPLKKDVQKVLNRFESYTYVRSTTDFHRPTGYEWHGERYIGPQYLSTVRRLSDDRHLAIRSHLEQQGIDYDMAGVQDRHVAELELIQQEKLSGFGPAELPDLMRDERPSVDERKPETRRAVLHVLPGEAGRYA